MSAAKCSVIAGTVLWLGSQGLLFAVDGSSSRSPQADKLVSVQVDQPVPALEPISATGQAPPASALHYDEVIGRALARPQPTPAPTGLQETGGELVHGPGMIRLWEQSVSIWEAPAFCHRPLYFEDENLERHGRSFGLAQPAVSAAHFAGRGLVWPYLAGAFPPHECIYTLGRDRPGSCADYRLYRPPLSARGAAYQAAAVSGLSFVVP